MPGAFGHEQKEPTLNRPRFHLSRQALLTRLSQQSQRRVTPDIRALLAYGLVVALGSVAMLVITGAPFAHVPMGI